MAQLVTAHVFHARTAPKRNAFRYGIFYVRVPWDRCVAELKRTLFSINRFNLFSLHRADYDWDGVPARQRIHDALDFFGLHDAKAEVELLTLPRVLGYAFNPVSFWLCHDGEKKLRAVIADVSNTFGEHHSYLCFHDDHRPIEGGDWLRAEKIFHVSPFLAVEGHYRFRFACDASKIAIWINHYEGDRLILSTSLIGDGKPLNSARLLYCFLRYPLVTLKVIGLIHYQAVKLFLKGVRHYAKPTPPLTDLSR